MKSTPVAVCVSGQGLLGVVEVEAGLSRGIAVLSAILTAGLLVVVEAEAVATLSMGIIVLSAILTAGLLVVVEVEAGLSRGGVAVLLAVSRTLLNVYVRRNLVAVGVVAVGGRARLGGIVGSA